MNEFEWFVDELFYFRGYLYTSGWAFHRSSSLCGIDVIVKDTTLQSSQKYGLASADVERHYGVIAKNCRFTCQTQVKSAEQASGAKLVFHLVDEQPIEITKPLSRKMSCDPYHALQYRFFEALDKIQEGAVLELGSRVRSASYTVKKDFVPKHLRYTGVDVLAGENVDVVGDAHSLSQLFQAKSFDALYCISVFEHLLMPWKVVLEINHLLKIDGLVMITTHQTWPMHDTPWDFWRFSDQAWRALFNEYTGFTILETALGLPGSIVPHHLGPSTIHLELEVAYLGSAVICKKIADTKLVWEVDTHQISTGSYPT